MRNASPAGALFQCEGGDRLSAFAFHRHSCIFHRKDATTLSFRKESLRYHCVIESLPHCGEKSLGMLLA